MSETPPRVERERYELVVECDTDERGAREFAQEMYLEFGHHVLVNKIEADGMVEESFEVGKSAKLKERS